MKKQFAVDADRAAVPAFRSRYRWLLVVFALALVLLGINAAFAIHSIGIIAANQVLVADTNEVLLEIAGLKLDFVKVQRGVGGSIITGDPELFQIIDYSGFEAGYVPVPPASSCAFLAGDPSPLCESAIIVLFCSDSPYQAD
jgi:hypothetical protein